MQGRGKQVIAWLAAVAAAVFGVATLRAGGMVLFGADAAREAAGDYVPFVVVFNTVAGLFYLAGAVGLALRSRWALGLALAIAVATLLVYAAFGVHILMGGAYEMRTVGAMAVRTGFWLAMAAVAYAVRRGGRRTD